MVLKHVTQNASRFVVRSPPSDRHFLGYSDLYVVDVATVPHRLEDRVGETEGNNILHRLLSEIVVDAVDLAFIKDGVQLVVERSGRGEIGAERLFHNDASRPVGLRCHTDSSKSPDGGRVELRSGGQIVDPRCRPIDFDRCEPLLERSKICGTCDVALLVGKSGSKFLPRCFAKRFSAGVV